MYKRSRVLLHLLPYSYPMTHKASTLKISVSILFFGTHPVITVPNPTL